MHTIIINKKKENNYESYINNFLMIIEQNVPGNNLLHYKTYQLFIRDSIYYLGKRKKVFIKTRGYFLKQSHDGGVTNE